MTLEHACVWWGVVVDGAIRESPNGRVALGWRDGVAVAVKVPDDGGDEAGTAAALRHFDGRGCVRLLDAIDGAVLMERAMPGTPLTTLVARGHDDEAMRTLCDSAEAMHAAPLEPSIVGQFPRVEDWGLGFGRHRRGGDARVPPSLLDSAEALFAELAATQEAPRLLHGDLHHDNVLWDDARGWLAIDPKGVIGEPAYEIGAALRNPTDPVYFASPAIVDRRSRVVAERVGLDRRRVVGWAFAQAVLSAVWSCEDGDDPAWAIATATAARALL